MRKKNILKSALLAGLLSVGATSCTSWLEVDMEDSILENTLFASNEGYLTALNGVYLGMNDIYSNTMTSGVLDVMAQYYNVTENDDHTYKIYSGYKYEEESFENMSGNLWNKTYALIANVNVILEHCDGDDVNILSQYYPLVKGEALALRAMFHFDMLRLYGPIYNSGTASTITIPYQESSSKDIQPLLPASEVLDRVMRDLTAAANLLKECDPVLTKGVENATPSDDGLDSYDWAYRQLRLNYYAVKALQARVLLWKGDKDGAYQVARNEIIDKITSEELTVFPWATREAFTAEGKPDRLFSSEIFFALYNTGRYTSVYSRLFSKSLPLDSRLTFYGNAVAGDSKVAFFYDDDNDWRKSMWGVVTSEGDDKPSTGEGEEGGEEEGDKGKSSLYLTKYEDFDEEVKLDGSETYRYMISLIRLSEVYLIAAECVADKNKPEALGYVNEVRFHRDCIKLGEETDVTDAITREFAREMIGEGQLFFYYKRRGMERMISGTKSSGDYEMVLSNYVWPLPKVEIDKRVSVNN